jgi:DNA invertase Pin-like site-specific DNA recombinase
MSPSAAIPHGKTLAYLRASTNKQDLDHQRLELLEYARRHGLTIDDFIEVTVSSRHSRKRRRIEELMSRLEGADTLMATELSRLGRSTAEVIGLVNELLQRQVRVIVTKQGLDIKGSPRGNGQDMTSKIVVTLFSLFAELERDLISLRTKEALAAKKQQGIQLGKPKGTIQRSMYDRDLEQIKAWLKLGLSARKISGHLGYGTHISLNTYVKKRNIREELGLR